MPFFNSIHYLNLNLNLKSIPFPFPFKIKEIRPLVAMGLLAIAQNSIASSQTPIFHPSTRQSTVSESDKIADELSRQSILQNAEHTFTLLMAEIILHTQTGKNQVALNTYVDVLNKTKRPEVAERALELAIHMENYHTARQINQLWKNWEPQASNAQERMNLLYALATKDHDTALKLLKNVLQSANQNHAKRIFLQLAQSIVSDPTLAPKIAPQVHEAAQSFTEIPEAHIADILYNAATSQKEQAVTALEKLAQLELEEQLSSVTQLAVGLLVRDYPDILETFFQKNHSNQLSQAWQELELEMLMYQKKYTEAYSKVKNLLEKKPTATLYIQAAVLSVQTKEDASISLNYLEKAYPLGTTEQKSRAATLASMRLIESKQFSNLNNWLNKINSPDYRYDKWILELMSAMEQAQWKNAHQIRQQIQKSNLKEGKILRDSEFQQLSLLLILNDKDNPQGQINALTQIIQRTQFVPEEKETYLSALYNRGLIYTNQNKIIDKEKGLVDLRLFYQLRPESAHGMNALGYTLLENKPENLEEAFELIKKAYQLEPESPQINDSLGWAYFKKGDLLTALPYLQFAYQKEPDPEIAAHLGEVYWQMGSPDEARKIWQEAWTKNKKHYILNQTLKKYKIQLAPTKKR